MTFATWVTLLGACLIISFTPGAGAINTMSNSLAVGHGRAIWGILGQQVALVIHLLIVAAGLGVVVANSRPAFDAIRYAGAAYLVYLGIRQFSSAPTAAANDPRAEAESAGSMLRRGFWVNLLNPKAIVFFLAFIPGFVRPDLPLLHQYTVICLTILGVDVTVMWLFFAGIARGFRRFTEGERGQRILGRVFGCLFVAVGIMLVLV